MTKKETEKHIENISIRKVIIRNIEKSNNTNLIHFYLEVNDFYDCNINNADKNLFATEVNIDEGKKHTWMERVESVKTSFPDQIRFFQFEIEDKKGLIKPKISKTKKYAYYSLREESEYLLKCSSYSDNDQGAFVAIKDTETLRVTAKDTSAVGARVDDRIYQMITETTSLAKVSEEIRLFLDWPETNNGTNENLRDFEVVVLYEIRKKATNIILFGFLTLCAFFGIAISQWCGKNINIDFSEKISFSQIIITITGILLIFVSSCLLYYKFNKK